MGKVVALSSRRKPVRNNVITQMQKKENLLSQAFAELQRETGINHRKLILGDKKEEQRFKMKQYQEALKEM